MATKYTFGALAPEYARRWSAMQIKPGKVRSLDAVARKIISGKAEYQRVEADTGVPWAVVGALHNREASCDFRGVLHNGEKILNTGRKTRLVPKGRGPFKTWHEASLDAIAIKGWDKSTVWSIEFFLFASEVFNGMGYRAHGVPSAYLWSFSDQYVKGKYVADHVWDADVVDQQMGVAPLMKRLFELDQSADFTKAGASVPQQSEAPEEPVTIDPSDGLSEPEVRALQQRLRDLGYSEVGRVDGKWGPRTVAGVSAFQATAKLPVTGELDTATAAALAVAPPRPVGASRSDTTASTLREHGDAVAKSAFRTKITAVLGGVGAFVVGVVQKLDAAMGYVGSLASSVPMWVYVGAAVGIAAALYINARGTEKAAVEAVRSGRDAGPA